MKLADYTAIIPAAGEVAPGLVPLAQRPSSAMIPLDGKPVIYWTLRYLQQLGFEKVRIAVRRDDDVVRRFVSAVFGRALSLEFRVPDQDAGPGYTTMTLGEDLTTQRGLIVLGDTHFRFEDAGILTCDESFLLTHEVDEAFRWCLVEDDGEGLAQRFIDKPRDYRGPGRALIGVYGIHDWATFQTALVQSWKDGAGRPLELSDALTRYAAERPIRCAAPGAWLDCGNPDNLARSRRRILQTRACNRVAFDDDLGTITKRSDHVDKFADEIQYYRLLPDDLTVLYPRVVDADPYAASPHLTLEYYGYPTLMELFVLESLDRRVWMRVFRHLRAILERMWSYERPADRRALETMYVRNAEQRVRRLAADREELRPLLSGNRIIEVNGRPCGTFDRLWPLARRALAALDGSVPFTVIHGDLCFSNVLYDLNGGLCKLIDPRGSFGEKGVWGDPRYDLAKLAHSTHGLYDHIVNDLFDVTSRGSAWRLEMFLGGGARDVDDALMTVVAADFAPFEIRLIEGLLFLTMGVFHGDHPRRQLAMVLRGLEIWSELLVAADGSAAPAAGAPSPERVPAGARA